MNASASSVRESGPQLSIVIPFYNEAENAENVLRELRGALSEIEGEVEVIAVNDGSSDETLRVLQVMRAEWTNVWIVDLRENLGQAGALWVGLRAARGRWIATLDGDGQNPAIEIVKLWMLRSHGIMLVGRRTPRCDSLLRRAMSRVANVVRRALLDDGVSDSGCSIRLFQREVCESFFPIRTLYSFVPAFAVAAGWQVCEVPVTHRARTRGVSKYGLRNMAFLPFFDLLLLAWLFRRTVRSRTCSPMVWRDQS